MVRMTASRAARYSRIKYSLCTLETAFLIIALVVFSRSGLSARLAAAAAPEHGFAGRALYLAAAFLFYYAVNFPLSFCRLFLLERRFSLSTQSFKGWFFDQAKSLAVSYTVCLVFLHVFFGMIAAFPGLWWLAVTLIWAALNLVFVWLAPVVVVPLFFKYTPVEDDALILRIRSLAGRMAVPVTGVFRIDMSRKTVKANAGLMGWGSSRRVVLGDTLQAGYTSEETEVILAHEFSHQKLHHMGKMLILNVLAAAVWLYLMHLTAPLLLGVLGLGGLEETASIPAVALGAVLFGIAVQPVFNYVSRRMEHNADRMALEVTGLVDAFISAMEKLGSQNLSDPAPGRLVTFFFLDHPPVSERIARARAFASHLRP